MISVKILSYPLLAVKMNFHPVEKDWLDIYARTIQRNNEKNNLEV